MYVEMSETMDTISVIIPTFNRSAQLVSCLEAIERQQADVQIQVCIANDGGEPVQHVLEPFVGLDVQVVDLPGRSGQVAARNAALNRAEGDFVALCDDDDRWLPGHLAELLKACRTLEHGRGLAYTDTELVWIGTATDNTDVLHREVFAFQDAKAMLLHYNPIVPSSVLFSREMSKELNGFDESMGHYWDWDFWLRASGLGRIQRVARCLTLYQIDVKGSNQSAVPERMSPDLARLCQKHQLGEIPPSNFARMLKTSGLEHNRALSEVVWDGDKGIWQSQQPKGE